MTSIISLAFLLAAVLETVSSTADIYQTGPHPVKHKQYNSFFIWGLDHTIDVWAPSGEGTFPVVYFVTGLAGLILLSINFKTDPPCNHYYFGIKNFPLNCWGYLLNLQA